MYKYEKYRNKNIFLNEKDGEDMNGGERYDCKPDNNYDYICVETNDGKYNSKNSCLNDCEKFYIKEQIINSELNKETIKFYNFIKELINKEKIDVYIKGGNVIGLKLLRMLYDKYNNDEKLFDKYFDEFLKLELIKDWDFSSYSKKEITDKYRKKLDEIARKYQLVPRAKTFILYQTKNFIEIENKALFEISILNSGENYSEMEIPLTTMKVKINEYNIKYIYMFAKIFMYHKKDGFNMNLIRRLISKIDILIHPCKDGFYTNTDVDIGCLNDELIKYIDEYKKYNDNLPQFIITHLCDPFRMCYRLQEKNIPKTEKIKKFMKNKFDLDKIDWLFDSKFVVKMIDKFTLELGKKINEIYKNNKFENVEKFMDGIYWKRIEIEYDKLLTKNGKKLLNNIFGKLLKKIKKDKVILSKDSSFYNLFLILNKK